MKSWISFLLPADEYKEKKMLYFFSEGAIILILSLIILFIMNRYVPFFHNDVEGALLSSIAIFLFYVLGRYILSGIEYTDIAIENAYKKELRNLVNKTSIFVVVFMFLYIMIVEIPSSRNDWFRILGLLLSISFVWFISSYISLKLSYKKNKELL